jgi:SET domain-containing protein
LFDHPKLGKVPGIQTLQEVKKDEEITVSYDYALEDAPPWYQELYSQRVIKIYQKVKAYDFESELKNATASSL